MSDYFFITESYPFHCNLHNVIDIENDNAILITHNVADFLTADQQQLFKKIIPLETFDFINIMHAITSQPYDVKNTKLVSHDDFIYNIIAMIAEQLGLKCYNQNAIAPFTNKHVMKQRLNHANIYLPQYIQFNNQDFKQNPTHFLQSVNKRFKFPLIAKPINAAGASNVTILRNNEALMHWCDAHQDADHYEIDEYIDNAILYHCDSIIKNGKVLFTQVSQYFAPCLEFSNNVPLGSITLPTADRTSIQLREFTTIVINKFNETAIVPDGVTHMEVFRQPSGKLIFLEIQLRPPGANVVKSYYNHLGINLEEIHLKLQMGKTIELPHDNLPYTGWIYYPTRDGIVKNIHLPILNKDNLIETNCYIKPGQKICKPDNILNAVDRGLVALSLVFQNKDYYQLQQMFETLCQHQPFTLM